MEEDEAGPDLTDIERELERVQAFLAANPLPYEAMRLLARQAVLLIAMSEAYRRRGILNAALKSASEAASLIESLHSRANGKDSDFAHELAERRLQAHSAIGLAQVKDGNLMAARKTLRFLENQLRIAGTNEMRTLHVARLERALDDDAQNRLRIFNAQAAQREAENEVVGKDWDETHLILDTLIEEIAERMAFASALVGRVSHPERFQEFVAERLRGSLLKRHQQPIGEISHVEIEIRQKAEERGRRLQMMVWESDEMLLADDMKFSDGEACTDETLKPLRDGFHVLGLPHPFEEARFAYPKWQMPRQNAPIVAALLQELQSLPAWSIWHFFHHEQAYLYDLPPLAFLVPIGGQKHEPRVNRLLEEHGGREQTLVAAARDYISGRD